VWCPLPPYAKRDCASRIAGRAICVVRSLVTFPVRGCTIGPKIVGRGTVMDQVSHLAVGYTVKLVCAIAHI
jgi:hypothetical protein